MLASSGEIPRLRRPASDAHHPVFHHPGLQPFADQTDDATVADPLRDETDQPVMAHRVEEPGDVGVHNPVHRPAGDPDIERIERVMRPAPRSEAIAEPQEVPFPDRVQHLDHGTLDDLVLQRGDAERPLPPVRLGDIHPPRRQRPVGTAVDTVLQIREPRLEILAVLPPAYPVHPGRRVPRAPDRRTAAGPHRRGGARP